LPLTINDVLWLKDGSPYQNVDTLKQIDRNDWTVSDLVFSRAVLNDTGVYQCAINISISPLIVSKLYSLLIEGKSLCRDSLLGLLSSQ